MKATKAQMKDMRAALDELAEAVNNKADIARHCGVKRQAVHNWYVRGYPPTEHLDALVELAKQKRLKIPARRFRVDLPRAAQ